MYRNMRDATLWLTLLYLDIPGKSEEGLLDVDAGLGGGLHELDSVLDGQLLSALFRNLQNN